MKKYTYLFFVLAMVFTSCDTEEPIPAYTLSTNISPIEGGKITIRPQSQNYKEGEVVTLIPEPNENWIFQNWEGDASGNTTPLEITMNSNKSIIGAFVKRNYPIEAVFGPSGPTLIIDVTNPSTGKTWMDRNLGATQAATSSTDENSYGDLYQWGRGADGHQLRTSSVTSTLSNTDQPGHSDFISISAIQNPSEDWRSPQNPNLWQGVNGVNNPCPSGYRLPTDTEWREELGSWSSDNARGAFASPLKLPMAGGRDGGVGYVGHYWSDGVRGTGSREVYFCDICAGMWNFGVRRASGRSVRCIKD